MDKLIEILPLIAAAISVATTAIALYITVRLAPVITDVKLSSQRIGIIEKKLEFIPTEEGFKNLRLRVQEEREYRARLDSRVEELEKGFPDCKACKMEILSVVKPIKLELQLELMQKLQEIAERYRNLRDEVRTDAQTDTQRLTRDAISVGGVQLLISRALEHLRRDELKEIKDRIVELERVRNG